MDAKSFLELGLFLRAKRVKKSLTQVQVAKKLGYSSQFIANWERGVSSPPLDALKKIIEMYDINQKEFFSKMTLIQNDYYQRKIFDKKSVRK